MSRTFKDRPLWVRSNDPKEERKVYHDHLSMGKPIYRSRRKRDADGKKLSEEKEILQYQRVVVYTDNGVDFYDYRIRPATITVPVYETVLVGYYAEECISETKRYVSNGTGGRELLNTCEYWIDIRNDPPVGVKAKRAFQGPRRRHYKALLRATLRYVDSDGFIDDDLENVYDREAIKLTRIHGKW